MFRSVVCILAVLAVAQAANWAVIVAGSNTWSNYRHQSDACHAFHIARRSGIPTENIINMVYDDLASNTRNPFPGKVFNKPTDASTPGYDVWEGCQKDYTGASVTAANFLAIIQGNADQVKGGNGKVLKSGPNDNVFIYYTDHGGVGIVAFPAGPYLGVRDLNAALKTMSEKKMFDKLVFYLEACESGSMFENVLPANIRVYATTAATAHQSSYAYYCPPQDSVQGKRIGSCLGDEYSIKWMESVDKGISSPLSLSQTWAENYVLVRDSTKMSQVQQYGDKTFINDAMSTIFNGKFFNATRSLPVVSSLETTGDNFELGRVNSRDVPLNDKYYEYLRAEKTDLADAHAKGQALIVEIEARMKADNMFLNLAKTVSGASHGKLFTAKADTTAFCGDCCDDVNRAVYDFCGGYTDYSFQYARVVHNLCTSVPGAKDLMVHSIRAFCMA